MESSASQKSHPRNPQKSFHKFSKESGASTYTEISKNT
jgi:hypothetical protein